MTLPKYPHYKDSGIAPIGEVPAHWKIRPLKTVFRERAERSTDGSEPLLSVSAYRGVARRSERLEEGEHLTRAETLEGYKICQPGDLVVNIMLAWNRGLGISGENGIVSPSYAVFRPLDATESRFLHYLLRSTGYTWYYWAYSSGVIDSRLRLYPDVFGRLSCLTPPSEEQGKIADFLDQETARIDALIEEQKRLIERLHEKRVAVIASAVTNGLDRLAPTVSTGVPWLGDVPAHWSVAQIRYKARLESGHTPSRSNPEFWKNCTIPWFTLADVWQIRREGRRYVYETKEKVNELGIQNSSARLLPAGAVILSRTASVGFPAILGTDMAVSQDFAVWIPGPDVDSEFLWFVLHGMRNELRRVMMGSTHQTIYMPDIKVLKAAFPPLSEQREIVAYLNDEEERMDRLEAELYRNVDLLAERRKSLISAAVTGKIDVRHWEYSTPSADETLAQVAEEEGRYD